MRDVGLAHALALEKPEAGGGGAFATRLLDGDVVGELFWYNVSVSLSLGRVCRSCADFELRCRDFSIRSITSVRG